MTTREHIITVSVTNQIDDSLFPRVFVGIDREDIVYVTVLLNKPDEETQSRAKKVIEAVFRVDRWEEVRIPEVVPGAVQLIGRFCFCKSPNKSIVVELSK